MKQTAVKFLLNVVITGFFMALMEPKLTGMGLHEWGGLAIGLFFIVHILLHSKWIAGVTKVFAKKLPVKTRVKYLLDVLLLSGFSLIIVSGMGISKTIDFSWLHMENSVPWKGLHVSGSMITLIAVGIHLGLNWNWVMKRFSTGRRRAVNA